MPLPLKSRRDSGIGQRRYRLAAYSTAANVVSKALNALVLFVSVPLTIGYLGDVRFGIWMTLVSMIGVVGYLDFGIGSSLLNQVAMTAATQPKIRLCRLITHGLAVLTGIGAVLLVGLGLVARYVQWQSLLHQTSAAANGRLSWAAYTLALLIGLSLPATGLMRVFWGLQRAYLYFILMSAGRLLSLVLLIYLAKIQADIYALLLATYGVQLLFTFPLGFVLWRERLWGTFDFREFTEDSRHLLRSGLPFFVLSLGAIVAWDSDNLIVAKVLGAAAVAVYAIAVRLFQIVELSLQAVNNPLWAAYADAHASGEAKFLRLLLLRSMMVTFGLALAGVTAITLLRVPIMRVWIHRADMLSEPLVISMAAWFLLRCCGNAFAMYLNGIRMMRAQVMVVLTFCLIALPLKFYWTRHGELTGTVLASVFAYCLCVIIPYATVYRDRWQRELRLPEASSEWV